MDASLVPALTAPLLFGAGVPLSKALLSGIDPVMMAGLLYLSAGLGLTAWRYFVPSQEPSIRRADFPRLVLATALGGALGPALLMHGLSRAEASSTSLLLNLEAPLTALFAALVFKEHIGRRTASGILLIAAGSAVLTGFSSERSGTLWGYAAVAAACLCWALDNNLSQGLSERDPAQVAAIKCAASGMFNIVVAKVLGASFPPVGKLGPVAAIGAFGYGASLACYLMGLRNLGAAKTAMYFALAPFFGAVLAVMLLGEPLSASLMAGAALMGLGAWVSAGERHEHVHVHAGEHEHFHTHDEHHRHHEGTVPGAHSHRHSHAGLSHAHPHAPDIHHRH